MFLLPRFLEANTTDVGLHREIRIAHLLFCYLKPCLCQRLGLIHVSEGLCCITFHFLSGKINLRLSEFLVNGQRQFKADEIILKDKSYNFIYVQHSELLTAVVTTHNINTFNIFFFKLWIILIREIESSVPKGKVTCSGSCVTVSIIAILSVSSMTTGWLYSISSWWMLGGEGHWCVWIC